ncbi:hypothetical protein GGR51DRAFT_533760 [Nemania sp. FL0031]|nr:hypothetical protein GGR51DRAFT_533760 [Nemania sp. FL0031]
MGDKWNFNLFQQIYCFAMMTGIVGDITASEKDLQDAMIATFNEVVPGLSGSWTISWGPRVYKEDDKPDTGPDNVWFAAIDEIQKICVVAIAGTQSNSLPDLYQDFDVIEVVDFNGWVRQWSKDGIPQPKNANPTADKTLPYCAKGTCAGVWNVLKNASTAASEGIRIDEYLRSLDSSYTIVFTGHSLGGALAPMSALGLTKASLLGDHTVKVLPSAGVSPGNEILTADYVNTFPKDPPSGEGYQVYNLDYYNTLDVVPQAWSVHSEDDRNLNIILDRIIHPSEDYLPKLRELLAGAIGLSVLSQVRYTPLPGLPFTGPPPPDVIHNKEELEAYMGIGHVFSYWKKTGIYDFMTQFDHQVSKRLGRPPKTAS